MAKLKKLSLVRPEIEVEISRPILGRLWLFVHLPFLLRLVKMPLQIYTMGYKATTLKAIYFLAVPKIKVVDCIE